MVDRAGGHRQRTCYRPNDATLAGWIRQCKRTGLFDAGKLLYERGGLRLDTLPEELQVEVDEDYQVCVRSLARATSSKPSTNAVAIGKGTQSPRRSGKRGSQAPLV